MDRDDYMRRLTQFAVEKALAGMKRNPERSLRNLVDMGLFFAVNESFKSFLYDVQSILKDPKSQYYNIIRNLTRTMPIDALGALALNIGYNGLVKASREIKKNQTRLNYPLSWITHIMIGKDETEESVRWVESILAERKRLGTQVFALHISQSVPPYIWDIMERNNGSVFFLWLETNDLTGIAYEDAQIQSKTIFVINGEMENLQTAADALRKRQMLYAAYCPYQESTAQKLLTDAYLQRLVGAGCVFAFSIADPTCPEEARRSMQAAIVQYRMSPRHPIILMDYEADMISINTYATGNACLQAIDGNCISWYTIDGKERIMRAAAATNL